MTLQPDLKYSLTCFGRGDPVCLFIDDELTWLEGIGTKRRFPPTEETYVKMPPWSVYPYRLDYEPWFVWHYVTRRVDNEFAKGSFLYSPAHGTFPTRYGTQTSLLLACMPWEWRESRYARWTPWFPSGLSSANGS
jgi:hypothetical protein